MEHQPYRDHLQSGFANGFFDIIVHPRKGARAIIINYPGYNSDINGYNNKYHTLAKFLALNFIGAVIQMPNIVWDKEHYRESLILDLLAVCAYAREHTSTLIGKNDYKLYLMGFSAGAGAVAGAAHKSGANKILLMAPSMNAAKERVTESLREFTGEVYIAIGEDDDVVGAESGETFYKMAERASHKELCVIPNCDHQFRGRKNGMIMSKAPLWAFAEDETFPSPDGGIVLY